MSFRAFLATAMVASLIQAQKDCEDTYETEYTWQSDMYQTEYYNCSTGEKSGYRVSTAFDFSIVENYDGGYKYTTEKHYKDDFYSYVRIEFEKQNGYIDTIYKFDKITGSSYYTIEDTANDKFKAYYHDGNFMSDSDIKDLKADITQSVIDSLALDSISLKSEHKSQHQTAEGNDSNNHGKDTFNWGWIALALFGSSATFCAFQAVRSRKEDDSFKSAEVSHGFLTQPAYETNVRSYI